MMFIKTMGLAAVFAAMASALPQSQIVRRDGGGVTIVNNLQQDIYAWSVADTVSPMQVLTSGGGVYSEDWRVNPNGGGISIKLSLDQEQQDVLQFEYTEAGDTIFWDMSCINMESSSAFINSGFAVTPSAESSTCPSAICAPGDAACSAAYLQPFDDYATHGCPIGTGLNLVIG
jgi:hypothetical protein